MKKGITLICAVKNRSKQLVIALPTWLASSEIDQILIVDWDSKIPLSEELPLLLPEDSKDKRIQIERVKDQPYWQLSKAYNHAAKLATYDTIMKVDADTQLLEGVFDELPIEGERYYSGDWRTANDENETHLNGVFFCSKKDFDASGGYNEKIDTYGWEDEDLYRRLYGLGLRRYTFKKGVIYHTPHSDSLRTAHQKNSKLTANQLNYTNMLSHGCEVPSSNGEKKLKHFEPAPSYPSISIVTSVYRGSKYIKPFLEEITKQTIFKDCELILINANSPDDEYETIKEYMKEYDNIRYIDLDQDPGLYQVWNLGIRNARGRYITNANLDDRRAPNHLEKHMERLENDLAIEGVAAAVNVTREPNETWANNTSYATWFTWLPERVGADYLFKLGNDGEIEPQNIMHCMPVWRKRLHTKCGYFNGEEFDPHCDWEFWLRCARNIDARYGFISEPLGLYLYDDNSHNNRASNAVEMNKKIINIYYSALTLQQKRQITIRYLYVRIGKWIEDLPSPLSKLTYRAAAFFFYRLRALQRFLH